jgi:hypothetical protein
LRSALFLLVVLPLTVVDAVQGVQTRDIPGVRRGTPEWYVTPAGIASTEYSEVEAQLYRFDIKPVTPESGINTGYVIAYGHVLRAPYALEVAKDTMLLVDGVQIEPPLVNDFRRRAAATLAAIRASAPPALTPYPSTEAEKRYWREVSATLHALSSRFAARRSVEGVRDSIRRLLDQFASIESERTVITLSPDSVSPTDVEVRYYFRATRDGERIVVEAPRADLRLRCLPATAPTKDDSAAHLAAMKLRTLLTVRQCEESLRRGQVLLFGAFGHGTYSSPLVQRIARAMDADSLTWQHKMGSLDDSGLPETAKELMYNYSSEEYRAAIGGWR